MKKNDRVLSADAAAFTRVAVVPVSGFALHAFALVVDALRVANREAARTHFEWVIATETGEAAVASSGLAVSADLGVARLSRVDVVIVVGGYDVMAGHGPILKRWLRRVAGRGAFIGCVDTGAVVLAEAGLLDGEIVAAHPAARPGLSEDYPRVRFTERALVVGERRASTVGGITTLDLMLALIERQCGPLLSRRVGATLGHGAPSGAAPQPGPAAPSDAPPALSRCVAILQANLDCTVPLARLADEAGVGGWTVRRLFLRYLGVPPGAFHRRLRLERARQLLVYSHASVGDVAALVGFAEPASFTRAYVRTFGIPPSADRVDRRGMP